MLARAADGLSQGSRRGACDLRNFLVVHSLNIVQPQNRFLSFGQRLHEAHQLSHLFFGFLLLGGVSSNLCLETFHLRKCLRALQPAQSVKGEISYQNRRERLAVADELIVEQPKLQHRVLHDVLSLVAVVEIARGKGYEARSQRGCEVLEFGGGHERSIIRSG